MKSTPLLMKGPLVRATLAGVKTETRRLVKYIPALGFPEDWCHRIEESEFKRIVGDYHRFCPYGGPGDRLWVREAWAEKKGAHITECYAYKADGICGYPRWNYGEPYFAHHGVLLGYPQHADRMDRFYSIDSFGGKWQPSIHMPREACRLELELVSVSIEFVQDITDEAIRAEGVADLTLDNLLEMGASRKAIIACVASAFPRLWHNWKGLMYAWPSFALRDRFQVVWDLIYGTDPAACWSANPPVWVLKYRKVTT